MGSYISVYYLIPVLAWRTAIGVTAIPADTFINRFISSMDRFRWRSICRPDHSHDLATKSEQAGLRSSAKRKRYKQGRFAFGQACLAVHHHSLYIAL